MAKTGKTCPVPAPADSWAIPELAKVGPPADASDLVIANYCDMDPKLRLEYQASDQALLEGAVVAFNLRVLPYAANRFNLLTTPTNALDPVELIDRLDTIIDAEIKKLFVGTSEKAAWEPTFIVRGIDDETLATPIELLQLDKANGPCPTVALAADSKPMPAGFGTKDLTAACKGKHPSATLTVALDPPSGQLFDTVKTRVETTAKGDRSFRYRIPAQVRATVMFEAGDRGSAVFSVAQLGEVVSLPAQRSSKTLSYDLAFIEATGGLKSFKLGSTGIVDAATIEAISDAGGTVLDARNKAAAEAEAKAEAAAAAAATAADELTIVTRQHTLLKLKHEICTIQKQYGLACTVQPSGEE
jgi:hypothetical protein